MQPDLSQFDLGAVGDDKPEVPGGGQFDLAAADAQVQAEARMRDNLRRALKENPDEFAAALDLSNRTTLPFDVVKRNQPDVANYVEAQKTDLLKLRIENPALFDWLDKTPENLTVARDDIGNLSGIEWFNKAVPGAFGEGMQQTELAQLRLLEKRGQATPDQIARADFLSEQGQSTYAAEGFWQKGLVEGVRQLPNMLYAVQGGMKQGLATAGGFAGTALLAGQAGPQVATPEELVTVPSAAVAGMTIGTAAGAAKFSRDVETGLAFDEFKKFRDVDGKPIDPAVASLAADVAGTLNAGLETFGLSKILETIPGIKAVAGRGGIEAVKLALKQPTVLAAFKGAAAKYGTAVGAEVGTEVLQELSNITAGELGKLASGQQFAPTDGGAIASRLEKTLEMAFYGTALLAAPGPAAGLVMDASRAKQSKITQQRLEALGESAKASKLRERLPEKYREAVDSIREKHGTVESVHIDAQQAGQLFQAAGLDGADFFREVMGDAGAEKWAEAVATGGRIEVPFADYATKIAASDWHGPLIKHSTLSAEGMTPFEAEQYDREVEGELERFRDVEGRAADPANAVFDDSVGQLIATGQSRKDAETNAIYRVGLYRAFGQRFGMSPEEFMARFPTTINGPGSPVLQARKEFNDLDPYIDAIRANKLPTDEDIYGGRLITAIIANGGIDPQSAGAVDLKAMDAGKQRVGLFRKGGRTVEEMAMTLSEGGFAELFNTRDEAGQPDYRELLDLVRDDLMGEVRNPNVKNQKLFDFRETSRSLATALDEAGIDVRGLSNKEVVEKLRAAMEGKAQPEGQALDQDFGQAGDATFDEAGARPEVVQWAKAKWGDQIAPNGRPVWQNFVAWFGDSKVVDNSFANLLSQPDGVGILLRDLLAAQNASGSGLNPVQALMLALAKNDKIGRGIVGLVPVDVVNSFTKDGVRPEDGGGNTSMFVNALNTPVSDQVLSTFRGILTSLSAKLANTIATGRDQEVGPALFASDFNLREMGALLSLQGRADFWGGDAGVESVGASKAAKSSSASLRPPTENLKLSPAALADLLNKFVSFAPHSKSSISDDLPSSKYIAEQGKPLVVYHGTTADFDTFDLSRSGEFGDRFAEAAFFTSDPVVAGSYAARWTNNAEFRKLADEESAALSAWGRAVVDFGVGSPEARQAEAEKDRITAERRRVGDEIDTMQRPSDGASIVPAYLSLQNPLIVDGEGAYFFRIYEDAFSRAQEGGHDGIIFRNVIDAASVAAQRPADVFVAFRPEQIKSAIGNRGTFAGDRAGILEQAAYHGTPHTIGPEGFSLSKIGTGEGAQAFGYGLYFADNQTVAAGYQKQLTNDQIAAAQAALSRVNGDAVEAIARAKAEIDRLSALNLTAETGAQLRDQKVENQRQIVREIERYSQSGQWPSGNLYTVDIPDEAIARMLDWDKPLSEQPQNVRDALRPLLEATKEEQDQSAEGDGPFGQIGVSAVAAFRRGDVKTGADVIAHLGNNRNTSEYLNSIGIPGIRYLDQGSRGVGDGTRNTVVFDDNLITITHKDGSPVTAKERQQYLDQRRPRTEEPKGSVYGAMPGQRLPDGSRAFRVNLLRKADLTTFVHETGHMAYAMMADLADDFLRIPEAERTADQARLIEDYQKLTEWTGAASFDTMTEKQLEKVARGFEAYVMEGKAPSEELRSAFSRVRSFMVAIYRTLKGLVKQAGQEIDLNDEVRAVFDRMLATEDQIAETRAANNMEAMFKAPSDLTNLNASGAEIAAYMRAVADDEQKATDAVAAKVMETIRRRRQADFEDLRATVRAEVAAEMAEVPVYRAMSVLADGKLPDGSPLPEALQGLVRGLDKGWLMEEFGQAWLNENLRRKRVYRLEGGMNPDLAAEVLGFTSGRALVTAMAEAAPRREYLEAETERRLNEIIPDPIRDGSISDEALAAIHNERRGEVLTIELKLLERRAQVGGKPTTRQVARRIAERVVSERRYRDLSPNRCRVAERKAAREAIKAAAEGNYAKAAEAKRQELLNFYLWKVSNEAQEKAERARDYLDRAAKQPARERLAKAGPDFVEQADTILSAYGFRPASAAPSTLREWVRTKEEAGYETNIGDLVLRRTESGRATTWRDLSMDELTEVYESVKSIAHLAKMEREWLQNDQKVDADIANFLLTDRLKKSLAAKKLPFTDAEASLVQSVTKAVGEFAAQLLHPQTLIEWFDGGETGPWHDFFWNQAEKAQDMRDQLRERVMKPLMDLVNGWDSKQRERMNRKVTIKAMGNVEVTRSTLISMALNMGNAGNLDRLMRGGYWHNGKAHQISDQTVREIKGYLSAEDWQLVQFMWDRVDTLWPDVVAFQKEMGGLVPERVEAVPVETEHGTFRGGYWPVVYDPDQSSMGAKQEAGKALSDAMGGITKATTKKSFLKARTQAARPLLLNFQRILSRHVDEVITDLSHRRFVLQANRILDDGELSNLIRERVGPLAFNSLRGMVGHTIADRRYYDPGTAPLDTLTDWFITNTAVAALGFKIATAIGNLVVAPIQAAARVSPKEMVLALRTYATDYKNTVALVHTLSPYMKHRAENMDASFGDVMQRLRGQNTRKAQFARLAMSIHQFADRQATTVIWLARFNQTKREHGIDGAVRLANKAIQQTQTAGAPKDLSAFQRSPQHKLAKLFLGPMIIMGNRIRDAGHRRGAVHNLPEAFGTLLAAWFIPSIMFELAVGRGAEGDEPEDWVKWALVKFGTYPFMTIPYLREGAAVADAALLDKPVFSRGHPVSEAIQGGVKAALAITDAAIDSYEDQPVNVERLTKTVVRGIGPLIGVPTGQLTTTGEYIYDVLSGQEDIKSPLDMKYLIYRRDADSQK